MMCKRSGLQQDFTTDPKKMRAKTYVFTLESHNLQPQGTLFEV